MAKKILKKLWKILAIVLIVLIALIVVIYMSLNIITRTVINKVVPQVTGTESSIGNVDLALLSGKIELNDLKIGNPSDFKAPTAFEFKSLIVKFQPKSILSKTIIIDSIEIDGTAVTAELNTSGKVNLNEIYANVNKFAGADQPKKNEPKKEEPKKDEAKSSGGKQVKLSKVAILGSNVNLTVFGQNQNIPLPDIKYVDKGHPKSMIEVVSELLGKITKSAMTAVSVQGKELLNSGIKKAKDMATDVAKKQVGKAADAVSSGVHKAADKTTGAIKGLFK